MDVILLGDKKFPIDNDILKMRIQYTNLKC